MSEFLNRFPDNEAVEGGIITTYDAGFYGIAIKGTRDDGTTRTSFCEDRAEYRFEMERTLYWLKHGEEQPQETYEEFYNRYHERMAE